jgi:hypothetical protein
MAVGASRSRLKGCKVHALAGCLGNRLQAKAGDHLLAEALPLFDGHRIEGTTVRVDADEECVPGLVVPEGLHWIRVRRSFLL